MGVDRPLRHLYGLVTKTLAPKALNPNPIPVGHEGRAHLLQVAAEYGPVPKSCREALETEVDQFLSGVESHNVVVLHPPQ